MTSESISGFLEHLENFVLAGSGTPPFENGSRTEIKEKEIGGVRLPVFTNEFWTARQRQAGALHEVSYRACFKPQLPRFFIELLTSPGDTVYDPFSGRGTTPIEAALLGRNVAANDVNPLSRILTEPRFRAPELDRVEERLDSLRTDTSLRPDIDLSMFYHADTLAEILTLRRYLAGREASGLEDGVDRWIRMVATNRLTGHSPGFFSVYTLPPNQAAYPHHQQRINEKRNQRPEYRDTGKLILRKSRQLLRDIGTRERELLRAAGDRALLLTKDAAGTGEIAGESVSLTVTSPPFLDIVQYRQDNWLRCWFNGIDADEIGSSISVLRKVGDWRAFIGRVFVELYRLTAPGGWVAFEVGEVRKKSLRLEDHVVPAGLAAGFRCVALLINRQEFTKTSNIWGVDNNAKGTNTNRIVVLTKTV